MIKLRWLFKRGARRGAGARLLMRGAYRRVLIEGNSTQQDRDLVLADLGNLTGFYRVSMDETSDAELRFAEGKRFVMARILHHLRMPQETLQKLEEAAKEEQLTNTEEGAL